MKIYISADIEGVTGTTVFSEAEKDKAEYPEFREQMTREVKAACEGALEAGASEIWIKDAHGTGRNLIATELPKETRLIRGWSGHPFWMMQELDQSFQASMLIGYHSAAGKGTNPMSHTLNGKSISITINDIYCSEFLLNTYTSEYNQVPMVFLSGDEGICNEVKSFNPNIGTCAVKQGHGSSTVNLHPHISCSQIREGVKAALVGNVNNCHIQLPAEFRTEIKYRDPTLAYKASFYPGMEMLDDRTIRFFTNDYYEVLRMIRFAV